MGDPITARFSKISFCLVQCFSLLDKRAFLFSGLSLIPLLLTALRLYKIIRFHLFKIIDSFQCPKKNQMTGLPRSKDCGIAVDNFFFCFLPFILYRATWLGKRRDYEEMSYFYIVLCKG